MRVAVAHVAWGTERAGDELRPQFHVHGATSDGVRCCVHVHGVYPYCYVAYRDVLEPDAVRKYSERLTAGLNGALERRAVVAVHLCKATLFYGYHERHEYFLKVSYNDPSLRQRVASALENGATGRPVQPYESHVPFELQWMSDYGVAGCSDMDLEHVSFRTPCPAGSPANGRAKISTAPIEVDVDASGIKNRQRALNSSVLVPSLRDLWEQDAARRRELGMQPAATPERAQRTRTFPWYAEARHRKRLAALDEQHTALPAVPPLDRWVPWAYDTPELFFRGRAATVVDQRQEAAPATPLPAVPESQGSSSQADITLPSDVFPPSCATTQSEHAPTSSIRDASHSLPPPPASVVREVAVEHTTPHYTDPADVPRRDIPGHARVVTHDTMRPFEHWQRAPLVPGRCPQLRSYTFAKDPPARSAVRAHTARAPAPAPTTHATQASDPLFLTVLALEVIPTTATYPDAERDPVGAVVYALQDDANDADWRMGALVVGDVRLGLANMRVHNVASELALIQLVIEFVRVADPEILTGYDLARGSYGYLSHRAAHHGIDLCAALGRLAPEHPSDGLLVSGRHIIDAATAVRRSAAVAQHSLEHVVQAVLHERFPSYAPATLSSWLTGRAPHAARAVAHMARYAAHVLRLLDRCDIIPRAAESARICGLDFTAALTRGSQFRVESMLLRIAKPLSYMLVSPSRTQVAQQRAAEAIPLVMEPEARVYSGPVAVLDFQLLYPSMIIAYNLCYSTCLGYIDAPRLGTTNYARRPGVLAELGEDVYVAPNGLLFVRSHVRQSLFARMLSEVLSTRVMVRSAPHGTPSFERRRYARQLSLKLLANVTYGYAGASFSGRMPCVELADAIVQSARETLEHAAAWISRSVPGARVVYGDTDSLFVHFPGRTVADAFALGGYIAESVTNANPDPVRFCLEKVYDGSVLVSKKRYAGLMYASPSSSPTLDVKGLEMVRRDGNVALQRLQEACLRMLFVSRDLSAIKRYCQRQWCLLRSGRISPAHLVIAKPVRLGTYATTLPPPGAVLASRRMLKGHAPPRAGERVPYLVAHVPGARLADRAIAPDEPGEHVLDADYYIRRLMVPALERILGLAGADVAAWYEELPRHSLVPAKRARDTLYAHYNAEHCAVCRAPTDAVLCSDCMRNPETVLFTAAARLRRTEAHQLALYRTCAACAALLPSDSPPCVAFDCPVVFAKTRAAAETEHAEHTLKSASSAHTPSTDAWEW